MKKSLKDLISLLSLTLTAIPKLAEAQSGGTPLLKIAVDENGKARVFNNMEGNEVVSTLHKFKPKQKVET